MSQREKNENTAISVVYEFAKHAKSTESAKLNMANSATRHVSELE